MPNAADYQSRRCEGWRMLVVRDAWSDELQKQVLALVRRQSWSRHPQTLEMNWQTAEGEKRYFIKVFHRLSIAGAIKDLFRPSRALRFWRQGRALSAAGFNVPPTIGAGELRRCRLLERAFVLTRKVEGESLPVYLARRANEHGGAPSLKIKRKGLRQLAKIVRQLHERGFVHGDLVASNLFVERGTGAPAFYLMDNDRTRSYPRWLPQPLWKRNLIQLNRMPLPTITLQDRVRFLRAYLGRSRLTGRDRELARWIESKTRQRRHECDGVDPSGNFRRLMRWDADVGVRHDG